MVMIALIHCQTTFLNMTGNARAKMICESIGIVFHIFLCYYFVIVKDYGIAGTGYASSITNLITYVSLLVYTLTIKDLQEAIQLPDKRAIRFDGLVQYF